MNVPVKEQKETEQQLEHSILEATAHRVTNLAPKMIYITLRVSIEFLPFHTDQAGLIMQVKLLSEKR